MKIGSQVRTRLGLLLLGAGLVAGFYGILENRFTEGGLYPHYASFRSDPMGTSAFYESLERLDSFQVSRNIENLNSLRGLDGNTAILLLGFPRAEFDSLRAPEDSAVLKAVEEGGRLVVAMNPELVPEAFRPARSDDESDWIERRRRLGEERARARRAKGGGKGDASSRDDNEREASEKEEEEEGMERDMERLLGPLFTKRFGFSITSPEGFQRPAEGWTTRRSRAGVAAKVPAELPSWRSQYRFTDLDDSWRPLVLVRRDPVVIERSYGAGSIVVTTDSYFVSNESLHFGGEAEFLLWLLGDKRRVLFDETIHGVRETGGAMKLIRRYRAHGVFFGLLVFLALWAWRSASSLVPGSDELDGGLSSPGGSVTGETTGSGLIRLLRRSVPLAALLPQCAEVWEHSRKEAVPPGLRAKVGAVVERHGANPREFGIVEAYAAITELLRKR